MLARSSWTQLRTSPSTAISSVCVPGKLTGRRIQLLPRPPHRAALGPYPTVGTTCIGWWAGACYQLLVPCLALWETHHSRPTARQATNEPGVAAPPQLLRTRLPQIWSFTHPIYWHFCKNKLPGQSRQVVPIAPWAAVLHPVVNSKGLQHSEQCDQHKQRHAFYFEVSDANEVCQSR